MDIFPFQPAITKEDRHLLNAHRSALIWFTGLSGSGKSTLAHAVEERLFKMGVRSYVLDGDNIRRRLNQDLGLSPEDRKENVRRIAEVARLMVDAGILVFAAFIAPYRESREYVRELMSGWPYYECFVRCPIEECMKRDPKGLYKKAVGGEINDMTGMSAPYEDPDSPDLLIDTYRSSLDECTDQVLRFLVDQRIVIANRLEARSTVSSKQ